MPTEFRILGPIEAVRDSRVVPVNAAKPRALLALLLLRADEVVAGDRLIEDLWGGRPPATAAKTLQTYVSQLRRVLGSDLILTRPGGYELRLDGRSLDLHRFEELTSQAEGLVPTSAARVLREALELWRGPPLGEFSYETWAQRDVRRLEELRLDALERRIDADLATGTRPQELVAELELLVADHPLRERLREQLMLALYRSGRPADALAAYREARRALVEELGIEPGASLRDLERAILDQDPGLDVVPPTSPRVTTPSYLPEPSTSFVGRARELREIRGLVGRRDVRLVTLTGAAGTGKTRLAVEAAAGLVDELSDGVVLVELAPIRDPGLVAGAILRALGLSESPERRPEEVLHAYLGDRETLLVLDNFEHVLGAASLVAEVLAGARDVTLLVTSRAPLDLPAERVYPVPALQVPEPGPPHVVRLRQVEAVRLFVERAIDVRADFVLSDTNADAIAALCTRLDGLPLALELAAARVKLLSPQAILTRLDAQLELLKAEPGSGAPERHRTLRAAIEWSYDLLDRGDQALFARLAVFVGGFTLEGAEAVAGGLGPDIVEGVESLLRNNLVRTDRMAGGEPRFAMLDTIREYALDRLEAQGLVETTRRLHGGFYLAIAEQSHRALLGPEQRTWLERLDAERGNLRAALAWATESGETETGLRGGAALWRYWQLRGASGEGRDWLERLLSEPSGSEAARVLAEARVASLALFQGDHAAVRRVGESILPVVRRLGDVEEESLLLGVMGISALALGEGERATLLVDEGLEAARRTGDPMIEAYAAANAGIVRACRGELDEAECLLEPSVREATRLGNVRSVAHWSRALGSVLLARGDPDSARALFEESLALHRTLDDTWGVSHALSNLALVTPDSDAARRLVEESVSMEREVGDLPGLIFNVEVCARLATLEGRGTRAVRLYACASVLGDGVGSHPTQFEWPDHERHVPELRSALGEELFTRAWNEGRAMTLDESLAYALAEE